MFATRVMVASILLLWLGQEVIPAQFRTAVTVPASVGRVTCSVRQGERAVARVEGQGMLDLPCDAGVGAVLSCDAESGEPRDVALEPVCSGGSLPMMGARRVTVRPPAGPERPVEVDWLEFDAQGSLRLLATRVQSAFPAVLNVAASPNRLVRIRREGFSPNTFAADALPDVGWQLPAPVVGGEVVIRSTSAIEPVAYLVRGAGAAAPYDTSADLLSVAGLGEGVHEVVPHFEGGIPGLTLRVGIQPGQSTPVALATDDIGGVTWELGPDVCADGRRLRLTRVETQSITTSDGTATSIRHYDAQIPPDPAPCRRTVAGLAPGQYQLIISGDGRVVARSEFSIQPGVLTSVPVESAGVRVGGTVTINGRPFREVVVAFFQGMPRPVAEFRPDAAGRYGGSLPETGAYVVRLSTESVRLLGQDRTVKIVEGQNLVDLSAEGGTLTLTLEGLDKAEDTKLDLLMFESKPRDGSWGIATNFVTDNPSLADNKIVLQGIGFADYVLYARQTSPGTPAKVSEVVTVAVREIQPDAAATLRFRTNAGRILLVDPEHRPVADAQMYSMGAKAAEISPGTYSLGEVPPGTPLTIKAPGFGTMCRIAPADVDVTVVLDRGRALEVRFPGLPADWSAPSGHITWGQAGCRVALDEFSSVQLPPGSDGTQRVLFSDFPNEMSFVHTIWGERAQRVTILNDVLIIPFAGPR